MKPVTLLGFGAWFATLGFLLGVPAGVMLTWRVEHEYQWLIALAALISALIVTRIAVNLKVRVTR